MHISVITLMNIDSFLLSSNCDFYRKRMDSGYNPYQVPNAGSLVFFNGINVHFDGLSNLEDEVVAKNTLFICQPLYLGNMIQDATKVMHT